MANRYWVGGTASWDGTAGTKWAATSGGTGGETVPTTADDVFFTNLSTGTCTISTGNTGAKSINCTGFTGTLVHAIATTITVAGSVTLDAGMTYTPTNEFVTFTGTGTLITAGKTFSGVSVNGAGITLTLGDALTTISGHGISVQQGTFNTANFSVTVPSLYSNYATTRSIILGSSTVNLAVISNALELGTTANLTFNSGTSQINMTGTTQSFIGGSQTFYNVAFTNSAITTSTISGTNIFNNLTFTAPSSTSVANILFSGNQTVNGVLSGSGASEIRRIFYRSNTIGTTRTLTLANATTLTNCDFRDITAVTNAITATSGGGNCGGNTNITFPAAKTVYWNLAGSQNWFATAWATTSGGTPALNNFPLAQDTAIFDNAGAAGNINQGVSGWNIGTLDMSARTTAMTFTLSSGNPGGIYGSWRNGTGVTLAGTLSPIFRGRGTTQEILGNGVTFSFDLYVENIGGTVRLTSAVTMALDKAMYLTTGTLDLQSYTLTAGYFSSENFNTRTIAFGTGNIILNGLNPGTIWNTNLGTASMTTTGARIVNISTSTTNPITVAAGSLTEANSINFNFTTGTWALTLSGGTMRNMNFTGFSGTVSNSSMTIYGDLNLGTTATFTGGSTSWLFAATSGIKTITSNSKTLDFPLTFNGIGGTWQLQDALTMGSTRSLTHTNGTLDLNGKTLTVGSQYTSAPGTKNLTFNGGTLVCPGTTFPFSVSATGFTTTAGTGVGTISLTAATAKTFSGGGAVFNCTLNQGGAGALTIAEGGNTFDDITNTVQPASILFTAGTTTTFRNFNLRGTAGNLITIGSVTAASHTLSKASGVVISNYLSISRSTAAGGATWYAGANSTDGGNNIGWLFSNAPLGASLATGLTIGNGITFSA